jgi:DNA-binding beta-propeller fold protein YncE
VRTAPVDVQPGGIVAVGDRIGVVSVRAYTFELLDPETLRGGGSQAAGAGPTHAVADPDGRVYVTDTRGDALSVFATRPRLKFVGRVRLPGSPYGIAIDPRRGRLWVTLTARNELVELSLGDVPRERRRLRTVRQPNTVAVDLRRGRVAVASRTDGTLQVVDP